MLSIRKRYGLGVFLLMGGMLFGCPVVLQERIFNALDVDVVATDAEGNPSELLISDMGSEWFACDGNALDSKIMRVDLAGNVLWEYDKGTHVLRGVHTADMNTSGDEMIISDTCHNRVLVIDYPGHPVNGPDIIWASDVDCPDLDLMGVNDANFLGDGISGGNLLLTVRDLHMVIELDPESCDVVWSFGVEGEGREKLGFDNPDHLLYPHNSDKLPNGNVMIADSGLYLAGSSRAIEIDPATNNIVWSYKEIGDCTLLGIPNTPCPAVGWSRDAEVQCADSACDTGMVIVTGMHQTVGILRDLNEPPPEGGLAPRGREVVYQVQHGVGLTYDSDPIAQWEGDTNDGKGYFLVSNHGPEGAGNWLRIVRVDASDSNTQSVWELLGKK